MAGGKGRRHPGDLGREALLQGAGALGFAPMMKKGQGRGQRCGSPSRAGPPGGEPRPLPAQGPASSPP